MYTDQSLLYRMYTDQSLLPQVHDAARGLINRCYTVCTLINHCYPVCTLINPCYTVCTLINHCSHRYTMPLEDVLNKKFSSDFKTALLALLDSPAVFFAKSLKKAFKGFGTHRTIIMLYSCFTLILYSYCTHAAHTVLMLYPYYTHTVPMLYSYCTHILTILSPQVPMRRRWCGF
jgi:hypothetical protein